MNNQREMTPTMRGQQIWQSRREHGGPHNTPALATDGTIRADAVTKDPVTECWHWNLSCSKTTGYEHLVGTPQSAYTNSSGMHTTVHVRRKLWELLRRRPDEPMPQYVGVPCDDPLCVNPEHLVPHKGITIRRDQRINRILLSELPWSDADRIDPSGTIYRSLRHGGRPTALPKPWNQAACYASAHAIPRARPPSISARDWRIFCLATTTMLSEVGDAFDLSRERVRQISNHVISTLKGDAHD